jgi:RNA polymerase sigma-70 factor (ECF subfamily)
MRRARTFRVSAGLRARPLRFQREQKPDQAGLATASVADDDVAAAAAGDVRAFEALYQRHLPRVHGLVRRMTAGRDADEVTQDVFVRAWQKLSTFRGASSFGTWLHRLAVNVVIERFRSEAVVRRRLYDDERVFDRLSAPRVSADLAMDFETAIAGLPDGAREIFVLHDVQGYKHREIAVLLEISAGTSKAQLHRARMMLRRVLRPGAAAPPSKDEQDG